MVGNAWKLNEICGLRSVTSFVTADRRAASDNPDRTTTVSPLPGSGSCAAGPIDDRLKRVPQIVVRGVRHDADNLRRRPLLRPRVQEEPLSERRGATEVPPGERLVDDRDQRRSDDVAVVEVAAGDERRAHRLEVAAAHPVQLGGHPGLGVALEPQLVLRAPPADRHDAHLGGRDHAGNRPHAVEQLALQRRLALGRNAQTAEVDVDHDHVVRS